MLVQVFKWIKGDVFVAFRLVYIFFILRIVIRISLFQSLISHILKFLADGTSCRKVFLLVCLSCRDTTASLEESTGVWTTTSHLCNFACGYSTNVIIAATQIV